MHFSLVSYKYRQSIPGDVVSGVRGNRVPRNAVAGGNGTFRLYSTPPAVEVVLKDENGKEVKDNLYWTIKEELEKLGMRVTEKRVNKICNYLIENKTKFEMKKKDYGHYYFEGLNFQSIINA